jgi:hypothetical protein
MLFDDVDSASKIEMEKCIVLITSDCVLDAE